MVSIAKKPPNKQVSPKIEFKIPKLHRMEMGSLHEKLLIGQAFTDKSNKM